MKSFWLNGYSGRQERWAEDGHRWVAAEPRKHGFALWGYQDDRPEIVYLGGETREEQLEKLADQFLLGDPETINAPFFHNDVSDIRSARGCRIESERVETVLEKRQNSSSPSYPGTGTIHHSASGACNHSRNNGE